MIAKPPVAVVAALPLEIAPARSAIRSRKALYREGARFWAGLVEAPALPGPEGECGPRTRTAVAAALGPGQRRFEAGLERLFEEWRPAAVALVGLAGGCVPEARPGDLYLCHPLLVEPEAGPGGRPIEGREPIEASRPVVEAVFRAAAAAGRHLKVAPSVTINVVASSARAKDSLGRNRGAHLCDMEDFWAARFCAARAVPFAALRAIYDGVADPLPAVPGFGTESIVSIARRRPRVLLAIPWLALRFLRVRRRAYGRVVRALAGELAAV